MKGWTTARLSDVIVIIGGGTPKTTVSEYWAGNIPWLSVKDFGGDRRYISDAEKKISEAGVENSSTQILETGDLVISARGTVGEVAQLSRPMAFNQSCYGLKAVPGLTESDFLYYMVLFVVERLRTMSHGSVFSTITRDTFQQVEVAVPPLNEQRAIAATLGALDDKIESNRRASRLLSILVDANAEKLLESVPTQIIPLGEVVDFNRLTVKPNSTPHLNYIDIASVSPGRVEEIHQLTWPEAPSRARRGVVDADVIFSTVRPGRRAHALVINPRPFTVVSTGFAVMTARPTIGASLLASVVATAEFAEYLESVAQGSAYPAVSVEAMGRYLASVPTDPSDAATFEGETMPLRRLAAQRERESARLSSLRDALLPELLSGRMRVSDACEVHREALV